MPDWLPLREMGKNLTKLVHLVNLIFAIACLLHVTIALHKKMYPTHPEIKVYEKELKEVSFPILFKICGKEKKDSSTKFRNFGYADELDFFGGISMFSRNNTIVGWNGHTENGSTIGPLKGKQVPTVLDKKCQIFLIYRNSKQYII